jgi:hypothetical protein
LLGCLFQFTAAEDEKRSRSSLAANVSSPNWPWDDHYKSILLPVDEEMHHRIIMMSAEGVCYRICQVCTPSRCYGASVGFRKGATMRLMCDTYVAAGVYWRISRPSAVEYDAWCGVSLSGIRQERGELGHVMPWVNKSQEKRNPVGFYAFRCI